MFLVLRPMILLMDWRFLQKRAQSEAEAGTPPTRKGSSRVRQLAIAGVLVVAAAVGVGGWFFSSQDHGQARAGISQPNLASTALTTARDVGAFLRESVTRDLGSIATMLRRSDEESLEDAEDEVEAAEPEGTTLAAASRTVRRRRREPTRPPELQLGIGPMPVAELPLEAPLFMVFDSSHPEVTPPRVGDIRLRSEFLPDSLREPEAATATGITNESAADSEQVGLVEVIVSEVGEVEQVKLISVPQNVHESMLLSAIKAWRFTPAEKDGMAVRYPSGDADHRGPVVHSVAIDFRTRAQRAFS